MPFKDPKKNHEAKLAHMRKNKDYYRKKRKEYKQKSLTYIREYKEKNPCSRCPESDPVCLQFHHKNPQEKDINLANAAKRGWSIVRIKKEIEKCEVLCANCHLKLHAQET